LFLSSSIGRTELKKPENLEKLIIIIDTREQEPYEFDEETVEVKRQALTAGDYSLDGLEDQVCIERKSLPDYVQSVIKQRDRFLREVKKLTEIPHCCIVVECDLSDVMGKRYRSGAHPNSVLGATLSLMIDHEVPVCFCSDRQLAKTFVEGYLRRVYRKLISETTEEN